MDAIGFKPLITTPAPQVPNQGGQSAALPLPGATQDDSTPLVKAAQSDVTAQAAEQKRYEAVQRASQAIANVYVVSDQKFTIFKDATGQYITRFTSLRDGKVTYIPEPTLFKSTSFGDSEPLLKIKV